MMQQNCLSFYHLKGCCLICKERKIGCWCDDCKCHPCFFYSPLQDASGGVCDHLRASITKKTNEFELEVVEGSFKLRYGKMRFLHIGAIRADGFFTTRREPSHWFRKYHGFALNLLALERLRELYPKVKGIRILYNGKAGEVSFFSSPKDWFDKGEPHMNEIYPFDEQIALDIKHMEEKENDS